VVAAEIRHDHPVTRRGQQGGDLLRLLRTHTGSSAQYGEDLRGSAQGSRPASLTDLKPPIADADVLVKTIFRMRAITYRRAGCMECLDATISGLQIGGLGASPSPA